MAQSKADAKGREISLVSEARAICKNVHAEGKVTVTGETTKSNVETLTEKVNAEIYSVIVIVTSYASNSSDGIVHADDASGSGVVTGSTYALAWATDDPPAQPKPIVFQYHYEPFFGYIFGKSDAERYYAFKYQIGTHRMDSGNFTYKHSIYWRDGVLDEYGVNASQFEHKYPLKLVIALNPDLVKQKK